MNSADVITLYTTLEKLGVEIWIDVDGASMHYWVSRPALTKTWT
jgi:hypothetical protein